VFRQILAALTGQSLSRLAARPADFWMKVKSRWRQNPGFVAATAAGTIGIGLAIVLGIQGGLRLLDDPEPGDDLASDASTDLGDADGGLAGGAQSDLRGLFDEPEAPARAPRRPARAARSNDDLIAELDDEDSMAAPKTIASSAKSLQQKDPFDTDDASDVDERPVQIKPRSRHLLDETPRDDEEEAPLKTVQLPVEADDEMAADESQVEPARIATKGAIGKAAPTESKSGPSFGEEESGDADADASDAPSEPEVAETTDKGQDDEEALSPGWKNQRSKSAAAVEAPPVVAQKSRAVETVIYSTPAAADASSSERANKSSAEARPADEARPSRLLLELAGPKSARVGQACTFEIRVRNIGKTTVEKVTLSVELPAALVHELAQSLEQQVGSLAPGRTYRALVRTQAKAGGRVTLKTDVAVQGQVETKSSATIEIGEGANATSGRPARR
jgi:uncharacterized repeat protein (TIGR01451 family)